LVIKSPRQNLNSFNKIVTQFLIANSVLDMGICGKSVLITSSSSQTQPNSAYS